jgi:predicted GIY-YIG superfamily endonuclease
MQYVYILESLSGDHHYVGTTSDLRARLDRHNRGEVTHTAKFAPWRIQTYFAFSDEQKAHAFERYLKTGSGRAFSKRHL